MSSFNKGLTTGNAKIDSKIKNIGRKIVSSTAGAIVTTNEKGTNSKNESK